MATTYRIVFTPDEDGYWTVTVRDVRGAITQARSVEQGLTRIREALGLFVDDADTAELVPDVRIDAASRKAIARARRLQERAQQASADAAQASREIVRKLLNDMSVRDVAKVIRISPARVGQLSASVKRAASSRRSAKSRGQSPRAQS